MNLPNGKTTASQFIYVREWRKLAKKIREGLGWSVVGYDPNLLVSANGKTFDLPTAAAVQIAELIDKKS